MTKKEAVKLVGPTILEMSKMIENDSRHLIAKLMESFWKLYGPHKKWFLKHLLANTPMPKEIAEWFDDSTMWSSLFREMIFYYSGRAEMGQPSKQELRNLIIGYIKSPLFDEALTDTSKEQLNDKDFLELVKEL